MLFILSAALVEVESFFYIFRYVFMFSFWLIFSLHFCFHFTISVCAFFSISIHVICLFLVQFVLKLQFIGQIIVVVDAISIIVIIIILDTVAIIILIVVEDAIAIIVIVVVIENTVIVIIVIYRICETVSVGIHIVSSTRRHVVDA